MVYIYQNVCVFVVMLVCKIQEMRNFLSFNFLIYHVNTF